MGGMHCDCAPQCDNTAFYFSEQFWSDLGKQLEEAAFMVFSEIETQIF
jgi:hypothetical protein